MDRPKRGDRRTLPRGPSKRQDTKYADKVSKGNSNIIDDLTNHLMRIFISILLVTQAAGTYRHELTILPIDRDNAEG